MIKRLAISLVCVFILLCSNSLSAKVRLPKLVSDGMVLQRDAKLKIWGWADAQEKVTLSFRGKKYTATTGTDGKWLVWLPAIKAGGPYAMEIKGAVDKITLKNILVGDVWFCAGQSNMVHNLGLHAERYADEIAAADYPEIRQFLVPTRPELLGPADDLPEGSWKEANPENVLQFSVVAYFFAKKLYDKYDLPIGLINASVGGTPIEAWTSEEGLQEFPDLAQTIEQNKDREYVDSVNNSASAFQHAINAGREEDKGMVGPKKWFDPTYEPKNWQTINIPGYWEDQGIRDLNGIVWYRKEIDVPASMNGVPARLAMGRIVDADNIYVNGEQVGNKTYQYPQRRYDIPAGLLKAGKNVFVIRVTNYGGKGGFVPDKPYYLAAAGDTVDLKGYWQFKVGAVYPPVSFSGGGIAAQNQPTALYNGMIAPLTNYAIKGIIWYQGESNAGRPHEYRKLLPALIADSRNQWNQEELPFLYAQLPNFMDVNYLPSESNWAELRQSQLEVLEVPNTGMAVTIDLGEWNDIHPGNKKPIGDRLALAAQKIAYNDDDVVYSGPVYTSATVDGNKVSLHFNHVGGGLISKDGEPLKWFAIAGYDKEFVWAEAKIEGDKVVVWSEEVSHPAYVRYAWADNPAGVNFYNQEGLPASPFEAQVSDLKLWRGKKAAVVLTYDDALEVHLDNAIPILDSVGFKGTFYISAAYEGSENRIQDWKRAAENGHELGNHTLYHPCDASKPGRSWVTPENDLSQYTTEQIVREIEMTNIFLKSLDGQDERTFAYTCGDTETGDGSFVDAIKDKFVAMRGVQSELNKIESLDLTNINCYVVVEENADEMIKWAEKAKEENALLVVLFHGVGGGHPMNVDLKKHNDFVKYLKNNEEDYWVTTMLEASKHCIQRLEE